MWLRTRTILHICILLLRGLDVECNSTAATQVNTLTVTTKTTSIMETTMDDTTTLSPTTDYDVGNDSQTTESSENRSITTTTKSPNATTTNSLLTDINNTTASISITTFTASHPSNSTLVETTTAPPTDDYNTTAQQISTTVTDASTISTTVQSTSPPQISQTQTSARSTPSQSTTKEETTTVAPPPPSHDNTSLILGILIPVFLIILVIFLFVLYKYYAGRQGDSDDEDVPLRNTSHRRASGHQRRSLYGKPKFIPGKMAISRDHFEKDYAKKSSDDNRIFRMEFMALQQNGGEMEESSKAENLIKNRYDNILAFDSTRVTLNHTNGSGKTDYINANYISGYLCTKKWIATQGPKEETFEDFWQMVWEQKSTTIIMITRLVENCKLKCHQYWPDEFKHYGDFTVAKKEEKLRNFYIQRVFSLTYDNDERTINQFHYIAWPDFGVPGNASHLLQFRRRILDATPPDAGPIVIHCSAGVGRTGTFIVIDAAIRQMDDEGEADIFTFLNQIREERMRLVQTDAQYAFAHKAVAEYIKFGKTEMSVQEFIKDIKELRELHDKDEEGETSIENEFQKLLKIPLLKDCLRHGRANLKKNRLLQIMPYDFNRVMLPRKPGQERSDYINASYIDGFKREKDLIVTQGPMSETTPDFWSMIWENDVACVVMLCKLEEKGMSTCNQYWPEDEDREMSYGDVTVSMLSHDVSEDHDYVTRSFVIKHAQHPSEEKNVKQFHYLGWPDVGEGTPEDPENLLRVVNLAKEWVGSGPLVVHCSSGGGRSGVFCCLSILLDQIANEGLIDVFQTAHHLREQRPHLIQTEGQYTFCYWTLLHHLEGSEEDPTEQITPLSFVEESIDKKSTKEDSSSESDSSEHERRKPREESKEEEEEEKEDQEEEDT